MASCPLCAQRKGKRACPAKGVAICAQCCGSKRRVEIACPPDCVYLTGAHAGSWEGRETERRRDILRVATHIQPLSEGQRQLFFLALVGIHGIHSERRELDDRLLGQAVSALRKTVETRSRGLVYEHSPDDVRAQGLVQQLKGLFEAKDEQGQPTSPDDRDLLPVLAALDGAIAQTRQENAGATAFLETVARLAGQMGAAPAAASKPLIVAP